MLSQPEDNRGQHERDILAYVREPIVDESCLIGWDDILED